MLKRNLAIGMAIVLSAGSLFGCGSSESNGETLLQRIHRRLQRMQLMPQETWYYGFPGGETR
ncbi:MAG: hypothetical protein ACLTCQ_23665 [Enterocloster bolteae]